jgi:hypothetical protein
MAFEKTERRFRRFAKGEPAIIKTKVRQLVYCSNKDACVFGYYASLLNQPYEDFIKFAGISDNVIGYRKIGSNIDLATAAFADIQAQGRCVAFAFDISGFFDNIDHFILKKNWNRILGTEELPKDHYKVFRNLTSFSTVNRRACFRRLGIKPTARDREVQQFPLCNIDEFRQKIRGEDGLHSNLIVRWKRKYRIPQGTPLSALAANIAMIDFDIAMRDAVLKMGGSYRRYSDDILLIIPTINRQKVKSILKDALYKSTRTLKIKDEKTIEVEFIPGALAGGRGSKALQYLGFLFDGESTLLRSSTISKFYRRMFRSISSAKRQHRKSLEGAIEGRRTLHRRKLLLKHSHLGSKNLITTYVANALDKMPNNKIRQQVSRHLKILNAKLV